MAKIAPFAATLLLCFSAASDAKSQKPEPTRARANLATYVSDEDYPDEAIRNNEQGSVGFRLEVGSDGKPAGCSVISSSGSPSLDATTCRIMMERAQFVPARDARGRAVPDQISATIRWVLPEEPTGAALRRQAATTLWSSCVFGEAAKLVPGDLPADQIGRRAFPPCEALEARLAREVGQSVPLNELRTSILGDLDQAVVQMRADLNSPDEPAVSEPQP